MTPAVFILGTSHSLQCGAEEWGAERIALLEEVVLRALSEHGIRCIAEEMSEDGLRKKTGARETVCQRVAPADVPVDFVDLGADERAGLALSDSDAIGFILGTRATARTPKSWNRSGCFAGRCGSASGWRGFSRVNAWPVLLVCGSAHAVSFSHLFERVGIPAEVICGDFCPDVAPQ